MPKLEQLAADPDIPWLECCALLYRQVRTVQYELIRAQWYRGTGTRMLLLVITRCWSGKILWRVYLCTDASVTVPQLLESYARRWSIEVAFREIEQIFGVHPQARAVLPRHPARRAPNARGIRHSWSALQLR